MGMKIIWIFISASIVFSNFAHSSEALRNRVQIYSSRYALQNVYQKLVSNRGEGHENLYSTRNFREVLKGVLYRGGANNAYHRTEKRDNRNPLLEDGLNNLCQEGFDSAIYLYTKNFDTASSKTLCHSRLNQNQNLLRYFQITSLEPENHPELIRHIYENIQDPSRGPIYAHCWNGWHASGITGAIALRQFCGWSGEEAVRYWDRNTDGVNKAPQYERVRQLIRAFVPILQYEIKSDVQALICPKE